MPKAIGSKWYDGKRRHAKPSSKSGMWNSIKNIGRSLKWESPPVKWTDTTANIKRALFWMRKQREYENQHGVKYHIWGNVSGVDTYIYRNVRERFDSEFSAADVPWKIGDRILAEDARRLFDVSIGGVTVNDVDIEGVERRTWDDSIVDIPLFDGQSLDYPVVGCAPKVGVDKGMCAYERLKCDYGLSVDQVTDVVGKRTNEGLTSNDIVDVLNQYKRPYRIIGLDGRTVAYRADHERTMTNGRSIPVYVVADGHLHILNEDDAIAVHMGRDVGYHAMNAGKQFERAERANHFVNTWDEILELYTPARVFNYNELKTVRERRYTREYAELEHSNLTKCAKRNERKVLKAELKADLHALTTERANMKKWRANEPFMSIYINTDNLYDQLQAYLNMNLAYPCDIKGNKCTMIQLSKRVTVYANTRYPELKRAADIVGMVYVNQNELGLSTHLFATIKDAHNTADQCNPWVQSQPNPQINAMLDRRITAWNWERAYDLKPNETISAMDYYRNYTSIAHLGNFYSIGLYDQLETGSFVPDMNHMYWIDAPDTVCDQLSGVTPFDGNGLYDPEVVVYCYEHGIITLDNILGRVPITYQPANDTIMREFIDYVRGENLSPPERIPDKIGKNMVNYLIGSLNSAHTTVKSGQVITRNRVEAAVYCNRGNTSTMRTVDSANGLVYVVNHGDVAKSPLTDRLIRMAIVQRQRLLMFKKFMEISKYATPVYVSTDAIAYAHTPGNVCVNDNNNKLGSTRDEEPRPLSAPYVDISLNGWDPFDGNRMAYTDWVDHTLPTKYTDDDIANILRMGRCHITGQPGSGKTYLCNKMIKYANKQGFKTAALAFMNSSANLVNGKTFHRQFNIGMEGLVDRKRLIEFCHSVGYLFVEEASNISVELWSILLALPPNINIFVFGDFHQHMPVDSQSRFDKTHAFIQLCNNNRIKLKTQHRSNAAYVEYLAKLYKQTKQKGRYVAPSRTIIANRSSSWDCADLHICKTNARRIAINQYISNKHYNIAKATGAVTRAIYGDEFAAIYVGMPIITEEVQRDLYYRNQQFTIADIVDDHIKLVGVDDMDDAIWVTQAQLVKDMRPAYAITTYKAQGHTIRTAYAIHELPKLDIHGMYVALSRAIDPDMITLII